jgi:hypothetical protein
MLYVYSRYDPVGALLELHEAQESGWGEEREKMLERWWGNEVPGTLFDAFNFV